MLKEERFTYILKSLKANDKVAFEDLAKQLQVSEDTVRRDIDALGRSGLLVKVRGGAISPAANPLSFQERAGLFSDGKQTIALKAQRAVQQARTVFMDGGTTMLAVAASLPPEAQLRIITNNLALVPLLATRPQVELIVLGGQYNHLTHTTLGIQAGLEIQKYQADLYLMGTCAIHSVHGLTATVHEDGELKKLFMQYAAKTVVLGNHEKLETTEFFKVSDLAQLDVLITDLPSDAAQLNSYRALGVEIW